MMGRLKCVAVILSTFSVMFSLFFLLQIRIFFRVSSTKVIQHETHKQTDIKNVLTFLKKKK